MSRKSKNVILELLDQVNGSLVLCPQSYGKNLQAKLFKVLISETKRGQHEGRKGQNSIKMVINIVHGNQSNTLGKYPF